MPKVRVKLLRPVLGREIGSEAEYDKADANRLAGYGAVEIVGDAEEPVEEKAEPAPANKAEGESPENKAESAPARKATSGRKSTKAK